MLAARVLYGFVCYAQQRGAQKLMTAQGGSSRVTLVLLGGLQVRENAFGLPSASLSPAKNAARAYVGGRTYTVRVNDDVNVIQLTKRSNR
jgi:hypothetical protein